MKLSFFNVYIILVVIWFVYNFIKKRKAIAQRQRRETENRQYTNTSNESEDDILRKLKNLVENENDYLEEEEDDDEYIAPSTTTKYQKNYEEEERRVAEHEKLLLERQKMYENIVAVNSGKVKKDDKAEYDYSVNKRKAISIFKASHEDLRKAIVYNAILQRRGKKIK